MKYMILTTTLFGANQRATWNVRGPASGVFLWWHKRIWPKASSRDALELFINGEPFSPSWAPHLVGLNLSSESPSWCVTHVISICQSMETRTPMSLSPGLSLGKLLGRRQLCQLCQSSWSNWHEPGYLLILRACHEERALERCSRFARVPTIGY